MEPQSAVSNGRLAGAILHCEASIVYLEMMVDAAFARAHFSCDTFSSEQE